MMNYRTVLTLILTSLVLISCSQMESELPAENENSQIDTTTQNERNWIEYSGAYTIQVFDYYNGSAFGPRKLNLMKNGEFGIQDFPDDNNFRGGHGNWLIKEDDFGSITLLLKFNGSSGHLVYNSADVEYVKSLDLSRKNMGWPGLISSEDTQIGPMKPNEITSGYKPVWTRTYGTKIQGLPTYEVVYSVKDVNARWKLNAQ